MQQGFASRYDEKLFLIADPSFKSFSDDKDFKELFGIDTQENKTRKIAWESDILYLEKRINDLLYRPANTLSENSLSKVLQDIIANITNLTDEQIIVELMKVIGSLGSGHNLIIPTTSKMGS